MARDRSTNKGSGSAPPGDEPMPQPKPDRSVFNAKALPGTTGTPHPKIFPVPDDPLRTGMLKRLKRELAKPVPALYCMNPATPGEKKRLENRVIVRVTRMGSAIQAEKKDLAPVATVNGLECILPEDRWTAAAWAIVEVMARAYYRVDSKRIDNPDYDAENPTLAPGYVYILIKRPEYRIMVWDGDAGAAALFDPDRLHAFDAQIADPDEELPEPDDGQREVG